MTKKTAAEKERMEKGQIAGMQLCQTWMTVIYRYAMVICCLERKQANHSSYPTRILPLGTSVF